MSGAVDHPVGLDAVPRISTNTLNGLSQAAKGHWLNEHAFVLNLDLVGGINNYEMRHNISDDGQHLQISVSEVTGLINERFEGRLLK